MNVGNTVDLVDRTFDEVQAVAKSARICEGFIVFGYNLPECLHHQMLNFVHRQLGFARNRLERHIPLTSRSLENSLHQRHQTDFLPEEILVVCEDALYPKSRELVSGLARLIR